MKSEDDKKIDLTTGIADLEVADKIRDIQQFLRNRAGDPPKFHDRCTGDGYVVDRRFRDS